MLVFITPVKTSNILPYGDPLRDPCKHQLTSGPLSVYAHFSKIKNCEIGISYVKKVLPIIMLL